MTLEELARYDGREGRRAYVAFLGTVYDVTESPLWREGAHQGMHAAGCDLTAAMADAPHGKEVFSGFPVVGRLDGAEPEKAFGTAPPPELRQRLREWYRRYHPHPATVHFPIALHLFAAFMDLLFLADPKAVFAATVFYSLVGATAGGLVAMIPGTLSWWVNYGFARSRPFVIKVLFSVATLTLGIVAIVMHMEDPTLAYRGDAAGMLYHAIVLLTGGSVIVIGYYGGKLTWPDRADAVRDSAASELPEPRSALPAAAALPQGGSVAILIGGAAGSGIESLENLLAEALRAAGYYLFATKEYMSRVRGGSNTTLIRVGAAPLQAPCRSVDVLIALDDAALEHARERCREGGVILCDGEGNGEPGVFRLAMRQTARKLGNAAYANSYAAGALFGMLGLDGTVLEACIAKRFAAREPQRNLEAARAGREATESLGIAVSMPQRPEASPEGMRLLNGSRAAGYGFLAGGCTFVASYPMSPSTGVFAFMASMARNFEMVVEQSEDEIAALNMVLGAWYAGGRGLTTTSGGGFALMGEAVSLAGMTETPAVIYLAQRPGPATGLPTRTEQGDLNLALYSGHGDFPRVVLAPGSVEECITCGHRAFEVADRFQVPVIVLSDQYLADSVCLCGPIDFGRFGQNRHTVASSEPYRRYAGGADGISPRAVPGVGSGLVCAVSDEHDERSQITEDAQVRETMVRRRREKEAAVTAGADAPWQNGAGTIAVAGWGSSRGAIVEALERLGDARLFQLHFAWVHPLNPGHLSALRDAEAVIVVENNVTGQFAALLERHGVRVDRKLLQSDGAPLFADRLAGALETLIKELP